MKLTVDRQTTDMKSEIEQYKGDQQCDFDTIFLCGNTRLLDSLIKLPVVLMQPSIYASDQFCNGLCIPWQHVRLLTCL